jgi:hypothetical protein
MQVEQFPANSRISFSFPEAKPLIINKEEIAQIVVMPGSKFQSQRMPGLYGPIGVYKSNSPFFNPNMIDLIKAIFDQNIQELKNLLEDKGSGEKTKALLHYNLHFVCRTAKKTSLDFYGSPIGLAALIGPKEKLSLLMDQEQYDQPLYSEPENEIYGFHDLCDISGTLSEHREYIISRLFVSVIYTQNDNPMCRFLITLRKLGYPVRGGLIKQFTHAREEYTKSISSVIPVSAITSIAVDYLLGTPDIVLLDQILEFVNAVLNSEPENKGLIAALKEVKLI